ncbi:MAG: CvpA family protein [Candidatus Eisenbacteria sp.]|nr:CvpA family protein [Candidatus Eisenbacteria bacterium]
MNALDIIALAIIAASGLMSFRVGLIREVFALGALLVGLFGAVVLTRAVASRLPVFFDSPAVTEVLCFLALFLAVYLVVSLVGSMIARAIRSIRLGWLDHLLGFVFGCARGAIVVLLLLIGLTLVLPEGHPVLRQSHARALAGPSIELFAGLLPERAGALLQERHEKLRDSIDRKHKELRDEVRRRRPQGERI